MVRGGCWKWGRATREGEIGGAGAAEKLSGGDFDREVGAVGKCSLAGVPPLYQ